MYKKCSGCKYICTCCSSRGTGTNCSGCENHYDEFKPAENIIFCPLDGDKVEKGWTITYIRHDDYQKCVAGRFKTTKEKDAFLTRIRNPKSGWIHEELQTICEINDYFYKLEW